MGHSVSIGGNRLGSGNKLKAYLHNYERSTHDLGYVWRSTMAPGTLVPFMVKVALPGDTFDIHLDGDALTHPTIGPLFGSYKMQLDVFEVPMRLYQGKLHMNMLGIGMDMSKVLLPQVIIQAPGIDQTSPIDNQQINPSSIWSYLGIRGCGMNSQGIGLAVAREFDATGYLAYWDIYKNYYANKQEEIGAVIHKDPNLYNPAITTQTLGPVYNRTTGVIGNVNIPLTKPADPVTYTGYIVNDATRFIITIPVGLNQFWDPDALIVWAKRTGSDPNQAPTAYPASQLFKVWEINPGALFAAGTIPNYEPDGWSSNGTLYIGWATYNPTAADKKDTEPQIATFPLSNIDDMRRNILAHLTDDAFKIAESTPAPYGLALQTADIGGGTLDYSQKYNQEGLALKTYQSDLFNNWISTEWIDGPDGISAITAVDVSGGTLQIDELNMSKKIYDMLNRIAISGGSYDDWLDAVYLHERQRSAENPMYCGGQIRNIVFQEVVSNAGTEAQPLGTLAGRGRMGGKDKGGKVVIKTSEPALIMGIVSITPHIDYSQGNEWNVNLRSINDLHKPALDEIGFQDLITDQIAYWDTTIDMSTSPDTYTYKSAGKQPAWVNYMTSVNKVYGNFADQSQQMFMVLNRRYEAGFVNTASANIKDLTTYIDPTKFNHIFADTRRDAQNFWVQIGVNITARRKMSAKVMPNL